MTAEWTVPAPALREKLLVSVEEAAERLSIAPRAVYELIRTRRLRSVKLGKRRLIPVEALREFVEQLQAEQR